MKHISHLIFLSFFLIFSIFKIGAQDSPIKSSDAQDAMTLDNDSGDTLWMSIDLKSFLFWKLASTPQHQSQADMFPETAYSGTLFTGFNRARLNWYIIDPLFYDITSNLRPPNVDLNELSRNSVRQVLEVEVFPNMDVPNGIAYNIPVFNLAYYPSERGAYNFDSGGLDGISAGMDSDGKLKSPESRWGGIMRKIEHYQAELLKPVAIEFWLMDPFMDGLQSGGDLYFNYGDISEDVMQDGKMFFEQGIADPEIPGSNIVSPWGMVPLAPRPETMNFSPYSGSRAIQDAGMDGMRNACEAEFFDLAFLSIIAQLYGDTSVAYQKALADPSADDYHYFRGSDYDDDPKYKSIIARYERFNGSEGNSPTDSQNPEYYPTISTYHPDMEDLNFDQVLNEEENYYQYKIHLDPENMYMGQSFIDEILHSTNIWLPNGEQTETTWYHFTIPLEAYADAFGDVPSFDSCNFMRLFLKGFSEPVLLRFATLEMKRFKINPEYFDMDVFPNPADTRIKVDFDEIVNKQFEVSLTDILGRTAIRKTIPAGASLGFSLDVSNLKPGLYVLKIATPDFDRVKKVYIQ